MFKHLRRFSWVFIVLCLHPAIFSAQNETSVLSGRVTDPSGLAVPAAALRLTRQATVGIREGVTDPGWSYRFDLLEPGEY